MAKNPIRVKDNPIYSSESTYSTVDIRRKKVILINYSKPLFSLILWNWIFSYFIFLNSENKYLHKSVDYSDFITEPGDSKAFQLRPRDKSKELKSNFRIYSKPDNSLQRV